MQNVNVASRFLVEIHANDHDLFNDNILSSVLDF